MSALRPIVISIFDVVVRSPVVSILFKSFRDNELCVLFDGGKTRFFLDRLHQSMKRITIFL
jgi:hypothetical protein